MVGCCVDDGFELAGMVAVLTLWKARRGVRGYRFSARVSSTFSMCRHWAADVHASVHAGVRGPDMPALQCCSSNAALRQPRAGCILIRRGSGLGGSLLLATRRCGFIGAATPRQYQAT
jgi:hypothetical protein